MNIRQALFIVFLLGSMQGCSRDESVPHPVKGGDLATQLTRATPEALRPLVDAEKVILFSIDGTDCTPGKQPQTPEKYDGYPVLGKLDLNNDAVVEITAALAKGLNDKDRAKCFYPRHGIRAVRGESVVDYVICFQCNITVVITDGRRTSIQITSEAQPVLDKILGDAGIPLAPKEIRHE